MALIYGGKHVFGVNNDHRHIDLFRDFQDGGVGFHALNFRVFRINRENLTGEAVLNEALHNVGTDSVFFIRCTNHSEAVRTHDFIQI